MKRTNILIMTATITPPADVPFLARTDPDTRLKDYQASLRFYTGLIQQSIDAVVFVDNSNSDVSTLQAIAEEQGFHDQVEILAFDGLDYPSAYGRAYGEFKLLDYIMGQSQIIKQLINQEDKSVVIWKVTGRYIIKNLDRIISHQPRNFDLYCNLRKLPKPWADMFLMAWTLKGYQSFLKGIYTHLKTDYETCNSHPEEMFIELLEESATHLNLIKRIQPTPLILGVKGADNKHYLEGRNLLKFYIRSMTQKICPWLWM